MFFKVQHLNAPFQASRWSLSPFYKVVLIWRHFKARKKASWKWRFEGDETSSEGEEEERETW